MTKEHYRKTKQKKSRFKVFYDEDLNWEDKLELLSFRKKLGKPSRGINRIKQDGYIHSLA